MIRRFRIWHWLMVMFILLIVFRFAEIIKVLNCFTQLIISIFSDLFQSASYLNFEIIVIIIEALSAITLPILLMTFKRKFKFLLYKVDSSLVFVLLISFLFLFASLITFESPEFSHDLSMTRMLPPFSKVKMIHLKTEEYMFSDETHLLKLKKQISFENSSEGFEYIDSVSVGEKIVCYQKGKITEISPDAVVMRGDIPVITSRIFLLGTDEHGRDLIIRLIYGTRISIFIGILSVIVSLIIGVALGFSAGFAGGFVDSLLSRITDMFLAFPIIFFVVLILALFGSSIISVIIVLGLSGWMSLYKIVKAEVINIKTKDYFLTARMIGLSKSKILLKEVFPVIMIPVTVNLVFLYGNVILAESALSYLGLGVSTDYPSWGKMIEDGQEYMHHAWWLILFPGLMLILTLLTANKIGKRINMFFNPRIN